MAAQQNTINHAELHFKLGSMSSNIGNGDAFVSWAKTHVLEAIDHHSENLTAADKVVRFPDLELDIAIEHEFDFFSDSSELRAVIWDQVYHGLKKAIRQNDTIKTPVSEYQAVIVLDFIRTGQLSTSYTDEDWSNLVDVFYKAVPNNQLLKDRLIATVRSEEAFKRLLNLSNRLELRKLLDRLLGKTASDKLRVILQFIQDNPSYFKPVHREEFYYQIFLAMCMDGYNLSPVLLRLLRSLQVSEDFEWKKLQFPTEIEQEMKVAFYESVHDLVRPEASFQKKEGPVEAPPETIKEGAYVGQAGLVLLAPFLPTLLKNMGHVDDKGQLRKKHRIPMLLHYLATGETAAPEWKLTLPKVLAGMTPGTHCDTKIRPSQKMDTQIQELLRSVIGHWKALKNTSPAALRATFLSREGTLETKNGFYYLYINEQTVDILLNYISWNYTTIKYKWMPNILFVEWNKT